MTDVHFTENAEQNLSRNPAEEHNISTEAPFCCGVQV
jgi:hypothetical protein